MWYNIIYHVPHTTYHIIYHNSTRSSPSGSPTASGGSRTPADVDTACQSVSVYIYIYMYMFIYIYIYICIYESTNNNELRWHVDMPIALGLHSAGAALTHALKANRCANTFLPNSATPIWLLPKEWNTWRMKMEDRERRLGAERRAERQDYYYYWYF